MITYLCHGGVSLESETGKRGFLNTAALYNLRKAAVLFIIDSVGRKIILAVKGLLLWMTYAGCQAPVLGAKPRSPQGYFAPNVII